MRQVCNVAYATLADGLGEEELEALDIGLGMREDPDEAARADLAAYQAQQGITFENPDAPVAPTPGAVDEEFR